MKIYNYNAATGEFISQTDARESPREPGSYLIPANATTIAVPASSLAAGHVWKFDGAGWAQIEDHRGDVFYRKSDAGSVTVNWLGPVGDEYTSLVPASPLDSWDGSAWVKPAPVVADAEAERDRRLALASFTYDFGDARGVHTIGTDEKDMKAWMDEVMPIAQARLAIGDAMPIDIVTNTGPVSVTPTEWMDIVNTGGAGRQAIWQYYFALIAMDPIPSDYRDDQYWSPPPEPEE
ncbi:hypothetical protein [Thalassospira sp. 11-3]|uniref:hypothetical protein n=1 Tax=Thalassospira sp. 11-3 TaxID=2135614 RepID=UPI000D75A43E|nr:hypothetical protein [Thalassospira sp. 11-3]PXX36291.1 hypothetical protein C7967_101684 [Thalassospira sp. 11-3]